MEEMTRNSHISRILTNPRVLQDPQSFFELYSLPIRRFFYCLCGNADDVDEQVQEFAMQFLSGSFSRFDPAKGRFRDYLKATLRNQVRRNAKLAARIPGSLPEEMDAADPSILHPVDEAFRQFDVLEGEQIKQLVDDDMRADEEDGRNRYHSLLQFLIGYQRQRLEEFAANGGKAKVPVNAIVDFFAERFSEQITPETARQRMFRAKSTYAQKMISEISVRLSIPSLESIYQGAEELGLLMYVHAELKRQMTSSN